MFFFKIKRFLEQSRESLNHDLPACLRVRQVYVIRLILLTFVGQFSIDLYWPRLLSKNHKKSAMKIYPCWFGKLFFELRAKESIRLVLVFINYFICYIFMIS